MIEVKFKLLLVIGLFFFLWQLTSVTYLFFD